MPRYDYQCAKGHVEEHVFGMSSVPSTVQCECGATAQRVFAVPAAIHFRGRGFYSTDVTGAQNRRRRPNVADDLPRNHDPDAAKIARSL